MTTAMQEADQTGAEVQGRAFTYDQLYRIKSSLSYHMNSTALTGNAWQSSYAQDNRYREEFTYDWNGNIKTVERYDGTATTAVKLDDLTYQYSANSNLLDYLDDAATACAYSDDLDDQSASNYLYDAIGEMTDDVSERITDIEWTPYGKVKAVHKDQANNTNSCTSTEYEDADVEFLYTAGQQRLCKIVKPHKSGGAGIDDQDNWIYYWYVYDAGGNPMGVYKQSFVDNGSNSWTVKLDLEENGVYGSGRTGIRHADDESDYYQTFTSTMSSGEFATTFSYTAASAAYNKTHYTRTIGYKQYEVSNHLGNVLVTISDKRLLYSATPSTATTVDWYTADVQSYTDYYVFGAPQTGRAGGSYRYGFNGMESDAEMKGDKLSYTTEFRMYDPRVGRWMSPDPVVKYWESPYAAFANNPVLFVDPSGLTPSTSGPPGITGNETYGSTAKDDEGNEYIWNVESGEWDGKVDGQTYVVGDQLYTWDGQGGSWSSECMNLTSEVVINDNPATPDPFWDEMGVDQERFLQQVDDRAKNPFLFDQGQSGYCGMASLMHCWAQDNPAQYRQVMMDLYYRGQAQIGNLTITRPTNMENYIGGAPDRQGMPDADFVLLASIRYSMGQPLFPIGMGRDNDAYDCYYPWTLVKIMTSMGYTDVRSDYNPLGEPHNISLSEIDAAYNAGYNAIMIINTRMLGSSNTQYGSNHYVSYAGGLLYDYEKGLVSFNIFTWGRKQEVFLPMPYFRENFFGGIIFK